MSTSESQPELSVTEELVAYLDGELSAEECRRVEKRLAVDADYRRQLSELDQAWSALEALPSATVDDNFTRTTIDMVAIAAERDLSAQTSALAVQRKKTQWLAIAGGVLLAAAAFLLVRSASTRADRVLVAELPVVVHLDELRQVPDVEFLRQLRKQGLDRLTNLSDTLTPAAATSEANWTTAAERRTWIDALSERDKADLAAKFKRYEELQPESRDQLQRLEHEIDSAGDRDKLRRTLAAYGAWIARQSPGRQSELRELPSEERLARVEELLGEERRTASRELSPADEQALQDAILELIQEFQRGRPESQQQLGNRSTAQVGMGIFFREMQNDERREQLQERLIADLSAPAQDHFESLRPRDQRRQLWRWIRDALQPDYGPQELQAYFVSDKLTADQREELLGLPRAEMEERLERMYLGSQLGWNDRDWRDDFRGPRGFGRDGRGPDRGPRDWDGRGGPDGRGPDGRGGPPRDFEGRRFDRGPGGRPPGPPPFGGPRDWDDRPPPPFDGPPPNGGPHPEEGPPQQQPGPPAQEEPI
jgi:hypothetical protein